MTFLLSARPPLFTAFPAVCENPLKLVLKNKPKRRLHRKNDMLDIKTVVKSPRFMTAQERLK